MEDTLSMIDLYPATLPSVADHHSKINHLRNKDETASESYIRLSVAIDQHFTIEDKTQ